MATRTTYQASVTFEYDLAPCQTLTRTTIVAANASLAARRALEATRKAFPNSAPRSIVVVLEVGERVQVVGRLFRKPAPDVEGVAV